MRFFLFCIFAVAVINLIFMVHKNGHFAELLSGDVSRIVVVLKDAIAIKNAKEPERVSPGGEAIPEHSGTVRTTGKKVKTSQPQPQSSVPYKTGDRVTVFLKNGSSLSGVLRKDTAAEMVIEWEGGSVTFKQNEIKKIVAGDAAE